MLYIYCAGGFGKEILDIALRSKAKASVRFVDDIIHRKDIDGHPVIRLETLVREWKDSSDEIVIANGEPASRLMIYNRLMNAGISPSTLIDSSCIISPGASIGAGVIVCPGCIIARDSVIEDNVVINAMTIVGHDVFIGESTVIASKVNLGGACRIEKNSYIGMGAIIRERIVVGSNTIVSMGAHVMRDLPPDVVAMGSPARPILKAEGHKVFK